MGWVLLWGAVMDSYRFFRTDRQGSQFRNIRRLAWLSRDLLDLGKRRKMCRHRRQGQATWEEYRDAGHHCKDRILIVKTWLELGRTTIKALKNMLTAKGELEEILVCCCHLLSRDIDKAEKFNAFFACFLHWWWQINMGQQCPGSLKGEPCLRVHQEQHCQTAKGGDCPSQCFTAVASTLLSITV